MNKPIIYVLSGLGLNCQNETARAWEMTGAKAKIISLFEVKKNPRILLDAKALTFPGGFSFGDEVAAGRLAALFFKQHASQEWHSVLESKIPILGICNGFQILCELDAFSQSAGSQSITLAPNSQGVFSSEWQQVEVIEHPNSAWAHSWPKEHRIFSLPVRNFSGRLVVNNKIATEPAISPEQVFLRYRHDWNGSWMQAAALLNPTGHILGLMPHPEGAVHDWQLPAMTSATDKNFTCGNIFFQQAMSYIHQT